MLGHTEGRRPLESLEAGVSPTCHPLRMSHFPRWACGQRPAAPPPPSGLSLCVRAGVRTRPPLAFCLLCTAHVCLSCHEKHFCHRNAPAEAGVSAPPWWPSLCLAHPWLLEAVTCRGHAGALSPSFPSSWWPLWCPGWAAAAGGVPGTLCCA